MIDDKMPIFICECCGNIIRAIAYEDSDVYICRICNSEMFKTCHYMNDKEYNDIFSDFKKTFEFKSKLFDTYVKNNENYKNEMHKKRLDEERKSFFQWTYGSDKILP